MQNSISTGTNRIIKSARPSKTWLEPIARAGYSARALIYISMGTLAIMALFFSASGKMTDSKGVLKSLLDNPFGFYLILSLGIGLLCYSIWRLFQSYFDADDHGVNAKGLAVRAGLLVSSVTHLGLAYYCYQLLNGSSGSGGQSKQSIVAQTMELPMGPWIVGVLGLVVLAFAGSQILKAVKEKYKNHINFPGHHKVLDGISKAGLISRAIIFVMAGGSLCYAAWVYDASQTMATKEVWQFLQSMVFGQIIVTLLAVGLFLFGVYSGIEARYRKI